MQKKIMSVKKSGTFNSIITDSSTYQHLMRFVNVTIDHLSIFNSKLMTLLNMNQTKKDSF